VPHIAGVGAGYRLPPAATSGAVRRAAVLSDIGNLGRFLRDIIVLCSRFSVGEGIGGWTTDGAPLTAGSGSRYLRRDGRELLAVS
jgi:hypothetical protein